MRSKAHRIIAFLIVLIICINAIHLSLADEDKIRIVVWSYTNEFQSLIEKYYIPNHPELDFEFQVYPTDGDAYTKRLDNILGSDPTSSSAPDIFILEASFAKKYINSNATGDLKSIGFTDEEMIVDFPSSVLVGQTPGGVQKGLSWHATPGVLMYRASLAKRYLGINTPEEFQQRVNSWASFLQTAEELKTASNGTCKMITGTGDLWNVYQYMRNTGWVVEGELRIDNSLLDYEDLCRTMTEDGLTHQGNAWSEIWFDGMKGKVETLCYFLPTWGLHYTLKPNCVEGWDEENPDSEENIRNATEKGTYGDWRLTVGPTSYTWGGDWIATNAAKTNVADDAKKAALHDLIKFFTTDKDFQRQYAADTGDFVSSTQAVDEILAEGGTPNPFLGGQDHYAIFAMAAALANGSLMTEYDDVISALWNQYVTAPYSHGEIDLETALSNFQAAVAAYYPVFPIPDPYPGVPRLTILFGQGNYIESYLNTTSNKYFVIPLGTEAQVSYQTIAFTDAHSVSVDTTGDAIQVENNTVTGIHSGTSQLTAWITENGAELADTRITANILVIDPEKTITIPSNVTWIETEAFKGTNAECIIIPGNIWVLESSCFSNCPNLKTVIWTGDASSVRVSSPFGPVNSILFLSSNGLMPRGLNPINTGTTGFSGF